MHCLTIYPGIQSIFVFTVNSKLYMYFIVFTRIPEFFLGNCIAMPKNIMFSLFKTKPKCNCEADFDVKTWNSRKVIWTFANHLQQIRDIQICFAFICVAYVSG